jgi:hypothetical protein
MFHIELRQFPNNLCHFNLTEQELYATVLARWARGDWIELEGRKWSPDKAKLTVLEGPEIPMDQLTMGRGWRYAERVSKDVTGQMLRAAQEADARAASPASGPAGQAPGDQQLLSDSLGLELLGSLAPGPAPLLAAWQLTLARMPERSTGECLALAERAVQALLGSGLIVLAGSAEEPVPPESTLSESQLAAALRAPESWSGEQGSQRVWIHRV